MTSTMRWLILLPAGPGAIIGGWLGEHVSLRASLVFAGAGALVVVGLAWRHPLLRNVRTLPQPESADDALGAEASLGGDARLAGESGAEAPGVRREAVDGVGDQAVQAQAEQPARR